MVNPDNTINKIASFGLFFSKCIKANKNKAAINGLNCIDKIVANSNKQEMKKMNFLSSKLNLSGKLKISVVSTGNYVMPFFLNGFLKQHPNVELVMDVSNKTQVIRDLEQNQVDFSLVINKILKRKALFVLT